jgi:hypothetical protein
MGLAAVMAVALVIGLGVWIPLHPPDRPDWRDGMAADAGIVNGQALPLIVVDSFDDEVQHPQPSLLVERQDGVVLQSTVEFVYVSPTGERMPFSSPQLLVKFDPHRGEPMAELRLEAWQRGYPLAYNVNAYLRSVTVSLTRLEFDSYARGWT